RRRPVVERPGDRAPPGQDPFDHQQRLAGAGDDRRVRFDRRVHVAARVVRRAAVGDTADDGDVDGDLQGSEKARLDVRRPDVRVRVHAGQGSGKGPPGRMRGARSVGTGPPKDLQAGGEGRVERVEFGRDVGETKAHTLRLEHLDLAPRAGELTGDGVFAVT